METWQLVLVVVGVVVVGGIAVLARRAQGMRHDNVEAQVTRHGWSRVAEAPDLVDRWRGAPFGKGSARSASNVISGSYRGRPILAFDYAYDDRFQEGTVREVHSVYAVTLPAPLPDLELTREGVGGLVRSALGMGDLRVGDEEFDRSFRIASADPDFASAVLHPDFRRRLDEASNRCYRFENGALLSWETGPLDAYALDPKRLEGQFDLLVGLVELVPAHVWQTYGQRRSS